MLITKSEAARQLGISRAAVNKWKGEQFFVDSGSKIMIDANHPAWISKLNAPRNTKKNKSLSKGAIKGAKIRAALQPEEEEEETAEKKQTGKSREYYTPPEQTPEVAELTRQAAIAEMQDTIYAAKIKEEKSKQEEIKTLELKKELGPMHLIKYFFSFAENMIQRSYRRFGELSPELEAFYLDGEPDQAVKLLLKEQEVITRDAVEKLIKSLKEEGYEVEK